MGKCPVCNIENSRGEAPLCLIPTKRFTRGEFKWSTGKEHLLQRKRRGILLINKAPGFQRSA